MQLRSPNWTQKMFHDKFAQSLCDSLVSCRPNNFYWSF